MNKPYVILSEYIDTATLSSSYYEGRRSTTWLVSLKLQQQQPHLECQMIFTPRMTQCHYTSRATITPLCWRADKIFGDCELQ